MRRSSVLGFVVALMATSWAPVSASVDEPVRVKPSAAIGGGNISISSHLLAAKALADGGLDSTAIESRVPVVTFAGGSAEVELRYNKFGDDTAAAAAAVGLEITGVFPEVGWLTGRISPQQVDELAGLDGLATVQPMYGYATNTGSVDNQADVSMRSDVARTLARVDGSGIEIGVISDTFDTEGDGTVSGNNCDQSISGTDSQLTGDLPASVGLLEDVGGFIGIDEGRGMAELIHDMAPGADLTFHTALFTEAVFAQGIRDLADCGADVIVDDIIYFAEPMFQDGIIAQAAEDVAKAGVPYFSSAGNQGEFGVNDAFADSGLDFPGGGDLHNFGPATDAFGRIRLDPGEGIRLVLQWNDPFSGTLGAGAINDFDLYLLDDNSVNANVLAQGFDAQGCAFGANERSGNPLEIAVYQNFTGSTQVVHVAVDQFCSGAGGGEHLRIATYGLQTSINDIDFEGDIFTDMQQYGHAVAENARSVAAVFYGEIDNPDVDPPTGQTDVEPFSSLGGDIPLYFDRDGNPLAGGPTTRFKPEVAAADGTNTTFFGGDIGFDPDNHPNFFGTSAAAPHAAAVAALLLDAQPWLTTEQVYDAMEMTAIDIEAAGIDALSGYGLVDAVNTLQTCNGLAGTIFGTEGDDVLDGTSGDDVIVAFAGNDIVDGKGGNDVICLGDGDDVGKGGSGKDHIFGQGGADELRGQKGGDTLDGGAGGDTLIGGSGKDTLLGGTGKDTLEGGGGDDTLKGEAGDDTLMGDGDDDTLRGGDGNDILSGGTGRDTLKGDAGGDDIDGGSGGDTIEGGSGGDTIVGGTGKDLVEGGGGKDDIRGGDGDDTLKGGGKADTIRGEADDDTIKGGSGGDTLLGGSGTDTVSGGSGNDTCTGETQTSCEL